MKVRKRDGSIQEFDMNKVKLTLERVSDETGMPFTGSDLRVLMATIESNILNRKEKIIKTAEIHRIVVDNLEKLGFRRIAKGYDDFEKGFQPE